MSDRIEHGGQPDASASGPAGDTPASGPAGGEPTASSPGPGRAWQREPRHFWRMFAIWVVLALAGDLIFWFVAGPHVPPGTMTSSAGDAQFDFNVLFLASLPVVLAVWVYMGYSIIMWRASRWGTANPVGGPAARSNLKVQVAFITITSLIVFGAFIFGTAELIVTTGTGGGEGPNPIWKPASKTILPIQVIAQQWKFTYRYPTFGGMETQTLVIPDHTTIAFHVTSIDVIHSFWAYQLGVKADANPQVDNVAFTTTQQLGSFTVRCSELCGIWHGAMFGVGKVLTQAQFMAWGKKTEHELASVTKLLPPFAYTYNPTANGATGVTGIDTAGQAPYSKIEKYGATPTKPKVTSPSTLTTTVT